MSERTYVHCVVRSRNAIMHTSGCSYGYECLVGLRSGEPQHDSRRYMRLVGKLNYLTITQPHIADPVHVMGQFMSDPKTSHCHQNSLDT